MYIITMDIITKINRIKALIHYNEFNEYIIQLNYSLNSKLDDTNSSKTFSILTDNLIKNNNFVIDNNDQKIFNTTPELWYDIVSDIYTFLYQEAYNKAKKIAIEKITLTEIEYNINKFNKNK